jgi:hypothetical protein
LTNQFLNVKTKTLLALSLILSLAGCATIQPNSQLPLVRTEQTLTVALAAVDSFLSFEYRRRADVPKEVQDIAARVRSKAVGAFESANRLRIAYKVNRSAENEASLLTALSVVDALVSEVRVWVPKATASGTNSATENLVAEAESSRTVSTGSWVALVPVFVDLAREVYVMVNKAKDAAKQNAEWDLAAEEAFAARLSAIKTAAHWKP